MKKQTVALIGYGEIGKAMDMLLSARKDTVIERWDADATKVSGQKSLADVVHSADIIFLCVQSWIVRHALESISPFFKTGAIIVCLAKGVEHTSNKTMDLVLRETLGRAHPFALLSGPMLADELHRGLRARAVIASSSRVAFTRIERLFRGTALSIEYSRDVRGVALSGVLKNVYAMLLGIADALGVGLNMKGALTAYALEEMRVMMPLLGGKKETVDGVGCLADFVATAYSAYSRNRRFGEEIVTHGRSDVKGEGIASFAPLLALIKKHRVRPLPLLTSLEKILVKHRDAKKIFEALSRS